MRSLVVYHSLSGTTRKVAELAAKELGADIVEVRATRYGPGIVSYMRAVYDSVLSKLPEIDVGGATSGTYDFVLVLAPVWAGHASTPIRAYLKRNRGTMKRSAFVLTCGGHTPPKAYDEMSELIGAKPDATFTLREADIKNATALPPALATFLSSLKLKKAA